MKFLITSLASPERPREAGMLWEQMPITAALGRLLKSSLLVFLFEIKFWVMRRHSGRGSRGLIKTAPSFFYKVSICDPQPATLKTLSCAPEGKIVRD